MVISADRASPSACYRLSGLSRTHPTGPSHPPKRSRRRSTGQEAGRIASTHSRLMALSVGIGRDVVDRSYSLCFPPTQWQFFRARRLGYRHCRYRIDVWLAPSSRCIWNSCCFTKPQTTVRDRRPVSVVVSVEPCRSTGPDQLLKSGDSPNAGKDAHSSGGQVGPVSRFLEEGHAGFE